MRRALAAVAAWWSGQSETRRGIFRAWLVLAFAILLAWIALRQAGGWVVPGLVAGAFGALAVQDAFRLALDSLSPASRAHRRLANRVESAVGEHAVAQASASAQEGAA